MISKQNQEMAVIDEESIFNKNQNQNQNQNQNKNKIPNQNQNELPTNLSMDKTERSPCELNCNIKMQTTNPSAVVTRAKENPTESVCETKIHLSFSVDRLLNCDATANDQKKIPHDMRLPRCCDKIFNCCAYSDCLVGHQHELQQQNLKNIFTHTATSLQAFHHGISELKSIVRPTPIRAMGNACESVSMCAPFPPLATTTLLRYHQHQQQQQHKQQVTTLSSLPLLAPLGGFKTHQLNPNQTPHFSQASASCLQTKAHCLLDIPNGANSLNHAHTHTHTQQQHANTNINGGTATSGSSGSSNINSGKRKRSWSRAVFSNLQRKGLEIQFQQQKYITKPDRRRLAARLNLTDAQVKVWFQNRRMKWRHTRENLKSGQEKQTASSNNNQAAADGAKVPDISENADFGGYSTDASSSVDMSEHDDDDVGEIDVVE